MGAIETVPVGRARVAGQGGIARRVPVRPAPVGPGRAVARGRGPGRVRVGMAGGGPVAVRVSAARPVAVRPARRPLAPAASAPGARWHGVLAGLAVAVLASVAVLGLGLLSDAARAARVPSTTAQVRVEVGESLWQVARRVAPFADPGAVAARIVELNGLVSPSVQPGEVLISPIE